MANFQFNTVIAATAFISKLGSYEAAKMLDISGQKFLSTMEGTKYKAYKDSKGLPTIGRGITYYEDGTPVKMGDTITPAREIQLFQNTIQHYIRKVNEYVTSNINQNQFNALVSFCYNCGHAALKTSTLLKKVNRNPKDATIRNEFAKWVNSGGKRIQGLVNRRKYEADLYFS